MEEIDVLLLEDSDLDADLTQRYLKNAGLVCHVKRVETREEFVSMLTGEAFDLILADYSLPDFDGQQALEITRGLAVDIPFIFVSGVLGEEVAIDSLLQGATDYVLKTRLHRLGPAVKRALAECEERRAHRESEAALRESELRYRHLVDSVQEYALFVTNGEGRITLWNKGAERLFGFSEKDALGLSPDMLHIVASERNGTIPLENSLQTFDGCHTHYEGWLVRRDGSAFWAAGTTAPVDISGESRNFITVIRDNTERRQAENERTALLVREQLARVEAEQRAELTDANTALARSNAELEQFAYAAAHDLQEPLRMVKSFVQMLGQHCSGKLDAKAEKMLQVIESGSNRMQLLVNDLLSYSRVLHDREHSKRLIDLNTVLDQALFCFHDQITKTQAEVIKDSLPSIIADGDRIGLVFQNLLSNALKYCNRDVPRIRISAQKKEMEWIIGVQDNGIGFSPQYASSIFGLFKRLHRADEYPGTGVGLALCKQIVEQHGGRIWAESEVGAGSTFCFSLPAKGPEDLG